MYRAINKHLIISTQPGAFYGRSNDGLDNENYRFLAVLFSGDINGTSFH